MVWRVYLLVCVGRRACVVTWNCDYHRRVLALGNGHGGVQLSEWGVWRIQKMN